MAFKSDSFKYEIHDDYDKVFDEKGNTFLAMRKISWGENGTPRYDLRKWYTNADGDEVVGKGVSFLTEEGPNNLANILIENGFGNMDVILSHLKDRENFSQALNRAVGEDSEHFDDDIEDDFYDPMELIDTIAKEIAS